MIKTARISLALLALVLLVSCETPPGEDGTPKPSPSVITNDIIR